MRRPAWLSARCFPCGQRNKQNGRRGDQNAYLPSEIAGAAEFADTLDAGWTIRALICGVEATTTASESEPNFNCFSVSPGRKRKTVDIYVYMQGQRRGPYEKAQLQKMWKRGQLPKDTLYWHDGMSQWAVISDLFASTIIAPPLPTDAGNAESMTLPPAS